MGSWILISTTLLLSCLLAECEFRKVSYLENSKTSFSTPEPAKYNDVFKVDDNESIETDGESFQAVKTDDLEGERMLKISIESQSDRRSAMLKRIVEGEMRISSSDFQMNGVLYSAENFDLEEREREILKNSLPEARNPSAALSTDSDRSSVAQGSDVDVTSLRNNNFVSTLLCSDCIYSIGSMRKDILVIKDELSFLVQDIHSAISNHNCTKREFFKPDYQWKLDGKCDNSGSDHACGFACSTLLHYPTTPKTPTGRSSRQLSLTNGRSNACAVKLNGVPGDFIDLGEWVGSCVAQPDRCPAGLSLTVWLRLDLLLLLLQNNNNANGSGCLIVAGDSSPESRGFAVFAARLQKSNGFLMKVKLRDATHVWNAEGSLDGHGRWQHFAFTWHKSHGLELFVNGEAVTRRQAVVREASRPSPLTRLFVGTPPASRATFAGSFSLADLSLYVSHLHRRDIAIIFYQESEMNLVGN